MMTASCPGFLDQYGIWNNGFDCSSPRVCCGTETDRYCCILSTSSSPPSSSPPIPYQSSDNLIFHTSNNFLSEKWFFLQMCTIIIFLGIILLIFVMICHCLTSIRRNRKRQQQQQRMPIVQVPLPAASPLLIEHNRSILNRISTISSTPSDIKSRCTDTSMILNTPLNLYPTTNSSSSTSSSTSSSYYIFPNEFERLCK